MRERRGVQENEEREMPPGMGPGGPGGGPFGCFGLLCGCLSQWLVSSTSATLNLVWHL